MNQAQNFQEFIFSLCQYWVNHGCIWSQPYDAQMGAGTFHPHTFLKGLGPEPWKSVYVQPCRRPNDGRYGKSPYRFQHYYQLQVLLKPSPSNIIDVFLKSLQHVGINLKDNDIGLLEDDWKGPTLGAWGLGWEVRANAQEVTQFTYFQQLGGLDIDVVCGEITYGLERLYMYANNIKNGLDIPFNENYTWGDIYYQNEYEFSHFNFKEADIAQLFSHFEMCEDKISELCEKNLVLPAYDYVLQASHSFNLLDARGAISVSERQRYIGRVRDCARKCAAKYKEGREKLGYPLLKNLDNDARNPIYPKGTIPEIIIEQSNKFIPSGSETSQILFEILVEEMPPSFQDRASKELIEKADVFLSQKKDQFKMHTDYLAKLNRLNYKFNISSRRISFQWLQCPEKEPDQNIEIWGPAERIAKNADGSLTPAGLGFCKKNSIPPNEVKFNTKNEGTFLYYEKKISGEYLAILLAEEFKNWIYNLTIPLKMKWLPENISPSFIRPVRSIIALCDDQIIPLEMFGIKSTNTTCGQRILSPDKVKILHVNDYEKIMTELKIEISPKKRREYILKQAQEISAKLGGELILDEGLLSKCAGLFESPNIFYAEFDKSYLRLPGTLITTVLKEHMNYFTIKSKANNSLIPYYIGVSNYKCNKMEEMIEGTKNVVTGRLDDGTFYFDTDLQTPFFELREKLKNQMFQENMGTLYDKSERLITLVKFIAKKITPFLSKETHLNLEVLETAAKYCKADLKSGVVAEFPDEMQGIMGGVIAREQNTLSNTQASELLGKAIEEHYLPFGAQSILPHNIYAFLISFADKLDSLCMMMNSGMEPKGNKDPLGMRRLGLSLVRLLGLKNENGFLENISIYEAVELCLDNMKSCKWNIIDNTKEKILQFLLDRVKSSLKEDFDPRAVDSLSEKLIHSPITSVIPFIKIISQHIKDPKYSLMNSLIPYRRARNLTQNFKYKNSVNPSLFSTTFEKNLYDIIQSKKSKIELDVKKENYLSVLDELELLSKPLSEFFDNVMVNDNNIEIKDNRLALLFELRLLYENVADFSYLQV